MRSRLFIKVYLTLLAALAAVAVASGLYWRSTMDDDALSWSQRRDQFIMEMLPAGDDPVLTQTTIERFAEAFDADISLFSPDGRLLAAAGEPLGFDAGRGREGHHRHEGKEPFRIPLEDGRRLVVRLDVPWKGDGSPLVYLALIAAVIGVAAYPVVRHLTRRLETLRAGVEQFGAGSLVTRVPVEGRDEIAAVAGSFNAAADRIEKLVGAHRALLANASHELRSPVTRLRMAMDLYGDRPAGAARDEMLANLDEIDQLVDEILLASRLDHVDGLERAEPLDLMALVAEEAARQGVEANGVAVEVNGDARLLTRLTRNLIVNAKRHGRPPVEVEVSVAGDKALLSVRDHGDGVPGGEAERVFEPFYRPAGRYESAGGWGLGLALVRQIAAHHGGTVHYSAPADGGARFVVELPRRADGRRFG